MSISTTSRVAGPFTGDGVTSTFPFTFAVFSANDLFVLNLNVAAATVAVLSLTANYSVTLNEDQDSSPGGSITLVGAPLAVGATLTITTNVAQLQQVELTNGGAFNPDTINGALDLLTVLVQQLQDLVARSLQLPLAEPVPISNLPPAGARAGCLLGFDGNGNPTLVAMVGSGTLSVPQNASGAVDGVNKIFTFTALNSAQPVPLVFAGGVYQTPPPAGSDYSLENTSSETWQITFTTAPAQGPITVVLFT